MIANAQSEIQIVDTHESLETIVSIDVAVGTTELNRTLLNHEWGSNEDAQCTLTILDAPKPPSQRISLSAHRLSDTRQVIFLVTGGSKAQAVSDWRSGISIPATAITPENGVDIYVESALLDECLNRSAAQRPLSAVIS